MRRRRVTVAMVNDNVKRLAVANGHSIFQMLLVIQFEFRLDFDFRGVRSPGGDLTAAFAGTTRICSCATGC